MGKKTSHKKNTKKPMKRKEANLENKVKEEAIRPIYGFSLSSPQTFSNKALSKKLSSSPYSFLQNYKTKVIPPTLSDAPNKRIVIVYSMPHISKMISPVPHGCDCGSSKVSSKDIGMISSLFRKF